MKKREAHYSQEGYVFKHKEKDEFARILYLGAGASIDDYTQITEEEYKQLLELKRQEELEKWNI